ncbi:1-phosphofructokinase family hexose kinase [Enterococcus mundtii]|uniref:Tagatose-6-phosphate kinase n=1 Tax=Enterococcus mundtii TaxID=53346 RepID=A0A2T5D9D1_ENTMU|nr:1-phosphofructokinase family hexose kinase [Enterococcus mundtii]MBE6173652.1 1-phosphofructokinase family hexose kinase [Enterococcus faecium]MDA9460231.1 Tagatose-6-phosphate kinase [Enterococcus mundtii 3F]MDB7088267.1 1-phosphofructokinase family hexose kinase [Enterococcus mundtii]PQC30634.1 tagatose-6-phosphate kinase [Enterococcus mundtii]PTO34088.1 tagatose-6-phosphate kinase [Enterococcus mundtii]
MILTITMNPSMDYTYLVPSLQLDQVNRVDNPHISIGGKGINAGRVIAQSGEEVLLTGILGGNVGKSILDSLLAEEHYLLDFLTINGNSRNAITIMHDGNTHTELVEKGLYLSDEDEQLFYHHLSMLIEQHPITVVCISGSVNSANGHFHAQLLQFIRKALGEQIPILMDISGEQLKNCLAQTNARPNFVKPNQHELEELIGRKLCSSQEIFTVLESTLFEGIDTVMVSQGGDGAIVKYQSTFFKIEIPKIAIVNTTGCGDSTVGGMAVALNKQYPIEQALSYSMACGMSNALSKTNGTIDAAQVAEFSKKIHLFKIKE